jgi:hypothetical protein
MIQSREHAGLAIEPGESLADPGHRLRQQLDRHLAAELRVGGPVHLAHAALAQPACELDLFTRIEEQSRTAEELAECTGARLRPLRALLDACVGLRLLALAAAGRYANRAAARDHLVRGRPLFLGDLFRVSRRRGRAVAIARRRDLGGRWRASKKTISAPARLTAGNP